MVDHAKEQLVLTEIGKGFTLDDVKKCTGAWARGRRRFGESRSLMESV